MEITPHSVVALTWILKDGLGELLDELDEPVEFLLGGADLLPKIEQALQGHGPGAELNLNLEPLDAFGDFDENKLFLEPRPLFPKDVQEGMLIEGSALPDGVSADMPRDAIYTVSELYPDHVVLDANHPLAGVGLRLALKVHGVREPTDEEAQAGTAGTGFFRVQPIAPAGPHLH